MWGAVYPPPMQFFLGRSVEVPCPWWHHTPLGGGRLLRGAPLACPRCTWLMEYQWVCCASQHQEKNPAVLLPWSQGELFWCTVSIPNPKPSWKSKWFVKARGPQLRDVPTVQNHHSWIQPPPATSPLLNKSFNNRGLKSLYFHISQPKPHLFYQII